ncbi:putative pre-mRNA-splicing factor ATP-dependent RNA helicase DHX16 [Heracleum sosnowskyi]|uniref:Pre-mRNA-splicing factor ATP-dependent RNA helicase DHX16 n=1 Tax=Heracleum sosnowskyi TaxID=360622 RepID=A0AAD8M538_9APIA|nr:putative pre-mRNA-splicing factor ATP-dependent RNA helicase DHX16 [Heracleum sosnowskyi]
MATICDEDKCVKFKSAAPNHSKDEEDALIEDQGEESLSFSDLSDKKKNENPEKLQRKLEAQEDFNFSSCGGSFLEDSHMCAADEVFFKGKLLPFRHSISSETGLAMFRHDIRPFISRSQSMDHRYTSNSTGSPSGTSGTTTRSSSIRSSLSSGSTSSTVARVPQLHNRKPPRVKIRNQFHSHPSPTPQIRFSTNRHRNTNPNHHWSQKLRFFHMGGSVSVQTPDIKFADLKIRRNSIINTGTNFGSRNSNSSTGTSNSGASSDARTKKKYWEIFNECKCKVDTVDQTAGRRLISVSKISNSCVNYETIGEGDRNKEKEKGKAAMSRHRTFEWLKQIATVDVNVNGRTDSYEPDRCN